MRPDRQRKTATSDAIQRAETDLHFHPQTGKQASKHGERKPRRTLGEQIISQQTPR